jgi:hypothetical protein
MVPRSIALILRLIFVSLFSIASDAKRISETRCPLTYWMSLDLLGCSKFHARPLLRAG